MTFKNGKSNKNKSLGLSLSMMVLGMGLLAYASVPIYSLFCKVTGYGGTTRQSEKVRASAKGNRQIKVIFDANVAGGLPWSFKPEQKMVSVKTGENAVIFYSAENLSNVPIVGTSVYNVTPHKAGLYFYKIQCFCFEDQLIEGGQSMIMPVSFFIDPEMEDDPDLAGVSEITLSYSFYKVR